MNKFYTNIVLIFFLLSTVLPSKELYTDSLIRKIDAKYGKYTANRFIYLKKKIAKIKNDDDLRKLKAINDFFNKVKYSSDKKIWNKKDYWATPFELLVKDKGDSEDFVFAKYFTLVNDLKMDEDKFLFTYVKLKNKNISYMVLTYYETKKSIPYILDSINYKVLPATKRPDIIPIYSFSAKSAGLNLDKKNKFKATQSLKFRVLLRNINGEKI
ncbi:MAG: transglutaminase-like cysteine peptidase [Halarcobacter sp.]